VRDGRLRQRSRCETYCGYQVIPGLPAARFGIADRRLASPFRLRTFWAAYSRLRLAARHLPSAYAASARKRRENLETTAPRSQPDSHAVTPSRHRANTLSPHRTACRNRASARGHGRLPWPLTPRPRTTPWRPLPCARTLAPAASRPRCG